jgi:RHS repeat-associated protein
MFRKAFKLVLASLFVFFFFCQAQASALQGPSVSIDVPESASGVITAVVKYSFPEDFGHLYVDVSCMQVRPLDKSFMPSGSSGSIPLVLDTTYWPDGTHTIKASAAYRNSPTVAVDGPKEITTGNTPEITILSPGPGAVSGVTQFNVHYKFPSTWAQFGLFGFYLDSLPNPLKTVQLPLSPASPKVIEGDLQFDYDTTYWQDGPHTIKLVVRMGTSFSSDLRPNPNIQSISITTENKPVVEILSPSGKVSGVTQFNVHYKFPSTQASYGFFRFYFDSLPSPLKTVQLPLSPASPKIIEGDLQFDYDTTYWQDGPHTIKLDVRMGTSLSGSLRPNPNIQSISITTENKPVIEILSPSGTVRGVIPFNVHYKFSSTQAPYGFFRFYLDSRPVPFKTVQLPLSPASPKVIEGDLQFDYNTTYWQDGPHTIKLDVRMGTSLSGSLRPNPNIQSISINVANQTQPVKKDQQAPWKDVVTVGEPINVANGNVFISQTDILIPAKEISLELSRTYNSRNDFKGEFGRGWRSNFDIILTEQPDQSVIEVNEQGVYTIYTRNPNGTYEPSPGKYSTLTKNPDGTYVILRKHGRKLYFDSQARLIKLEEKNGNAINILRTSGGMITAVSDPSGRKLLFTHDSQGNVIQVKDPANRVFKYEYDPKGNLIKTTDPPGKGTQYKYDSSHNLIQQTDANNHSLYFEYDSSHRAYHSWQDGNNNEVTLSFDPANNITTVTNSLGNITRYEYNDYGLVTKITDSQNKVQTFVWDSNMNKTSVTRQDGNKTAFSFDARGNLLTITDPLGKTTTFTYNTNYDFVSSVTDALGNKTEYIYDAKGNLIQLKDAAGNTYKYSYDSSGQLIEIEDANNSITKFSYDGYGNLIQTTDALDNQIKFAFDVIGNVNQVTDPKGNSTHFTHDLLNRLIQVTYPDNSKVSSSYDARGNLVSYTDQQGHSTTYAYDTADRLIQITDALGNVTKKTYDTEGNLTGIIDANTNKNQYLYDSLNRLIKIIDALNNQAVMNYDPVGNLISRTDANGNTMKYSYDANNRLIKITYPGSSMVSFAYGALGSRTSMTDSTGTTTYAYDPLNRLIRVDGPQADDTISYGYDNVGNRIRMIDQNGSKTTYTYDSLNRPVNLKNPQNDAVTYSFDAVGCLVQVNYPNNTQTNYTYDNLNRLISLTDKAGANTISSYVYEYNPSGMCTRVKLANGDYILYSYDTLNRLTKEERYSQNDRLLYSLAYTYDSTGSRLTQKIDFQYKEVKIKDYPKEAALEYTYNSNNQLVQLKVYTISKKGKTKLKMTVDYTYDSNGNLIKEAITDSDNQSKETRTYTYDYENRLTQLKITEPADNRSKTIEFTYDGLGKRTSQTIVNPDKEDDPHFRSFLYDGGNVIIERGENKRTFATYTRGLNYPGGISGIISYQSKSQKSFYFHYDGIGNVTELTDARARTRASYLYDAFGNVLSKKGRTHDNRYRFSTKHQHERLYYFGARYYDPGIGRFITPDPLGMIDSTNLYAYVSNNPVNLIDPWGLCEYKEKSWWDYYWEAFWLGILMDRPSIGGSITLIPFNTIWISTSGMGWSITTTLFGVSIDLQSRTVGDAVFEVGGGWRYSGLGIILDKSGNIQAAAAHIGFGFPDIKHPVVYTSFPVISRQWRRK